MLPDIPKYLHKILLEHDYDAERRLRKIGRDRDVEFISCKGFVAKLIRKINWHYRDQNKHMMLIVPESEQNFSMLIDMIDASYDELELDKLGIERTALFVIISDTDDTFNFIVSIMYTQLFNLLCEIADNVYNGRQPIHVRCLLDEFANIGQIPKFEKLIATIRSREISASIILQSKSQLKAIYKDNADTIEGNCDTTLFLGGKEKTTLKEMAEILGKETIDLYSTSDTSGTSQSYGLNYHKTGKDLLTADEVRMLDNRYALLFIRGETCNGSQV